MKPIDLSVLIDSSILCEGRYINYDGSFNSYTGLLSKGPSYYCIGDYQVHEFHPLINHWHSWQGGNCPLPEGLVVDVTYRDGSQFNKPNYFNHPFWGRIENSKPCPSDIIAFRIIGLADGYCWPWQLEGE